jgi:hypothetical protein
MEGSLTRRGIGGGGLKLRKYQKKIYKNKKLRHKYCDYLSLPLRVIVVNTDTANAEHAAISSIPVSGVNNQY